RAYVWNFGTKANASTEEWTLDGHDPAHTCRYEPKSKSTHFVVNSNTYNGPTMWGTATFTNNGASVSSYRVSFDVPPGAHGTKDAVPAGATLSPLNGTGPGAATVSNHCVFIWMNSPLAAGARLTFN